jgi:hypothetical protein
MIRILERFLVAVCMTAIGTIAVSANEQELKAHVEGMVGKTAFVHVQKTEDWSACPANVPKVTATPADFIGPVCHPEIQYVAPRNQFSDMAANGKDLGQFNRIEGTYYPLNLGTIKRVLVNKVSEVGLLNCEWHVQYRSWINDRNGIFHAITEGTFVDGLLQDACLVAVGEKWAVKYNMAVLE